MRVKLQKSLYYFFLSSAWLHSHYMESHTKHVVHMIDQLIINKQHLYESWLGIPRMKSLTILKNVNVREVWKWGAPWRKRSQEGMMEILSPFINESSQLALVDFLAIPTTLIGALNVHNLIECRLTLLECSQLVKCMVPCNSFGWKSKNSQKLTKTHMATNHPKDPIKQSRTHWTCTPPLVKCQDPTHKLLHPHGNAQST